ncbi:4-hydroxy-tetrahydrodipicolinate reductase [Oxobacter pfennigii]|uniref:4-hydroxy-tetrahydrodipicolinate reductase n=1 Tax=Oxobacter pfennigii TaxID=36849 RepID=A0A0P8W3P3_9CLOT|nr:4-hydroxy-tetrahydrodipicolinate reductase [Oxobacter pfennigii]KPU42206.1 4-hydroxy-tetrahydrodipicolinate reductase [Oxobacter pfennigii]
MIRILLNGCNGRMGQVVSGMVKDDEGITIAAGVDTTPDRFTNDYSVYSALNTVKEKADVIVDFSNPKGLPILLAYGIEKKIPMVICTTGHSPEDKENIKSASEKVAILTSANMSLGVNLLLNLVKQAAKALEENFDIEIIEKHHNQKIDSPSGTALIIADTINNALKEKKEYVYGRHSKTGKRTFQELGIHSIRGGNIVGDHSVIFAGAGEVIEVNHSALSRDVFAVGAIRAVKYLYNKKPGFYNMDDVIINK